MENESVITEIEENPEDTEAIEDISDDAEAVIEEEAVSDGGADELFDASPDTDELEELIAEFPELSERNKSELFDEARYSELRELGATPREAYLATARVRAVITDNRSHLSSAVPRGAKSPIGKMSASELRAARELFAGASDKEIMRLYKRVTN